MLGTGLRSRGRQLAKDGSSGAPSQLAGTTGTPLIASPAHVVATCVDGALLHTCADQGSESWTGARPLQASSDLDSSAGASRNAPLGCLRI